MSKSYVLSGFRTGKEVIAFLAGRQTKIRTIDAASIRVLDIRGLGWGVPHPGCYVVSPTGEYFRTV
jgi:hypothetical protein